MSFSKNPGIKVTGLLACFYLSIASPMAADWTIPVGANSFRTAPSPSGDGFRQNGAIAWSAEEDVYSIYFHLDRAATLNLSLVARNLEGVSILEAACKELRSEVTIDSTELVSYPIGAISVKEAGYIRVDLRGLEREAGEFAEIFELRVTSDTEGLILKFVETLTDGFSFWGRSGPSIHLLFDAPTEPSIRYVYAEVTVDEESAYPGAVVLALGSQKGYFRFRVALDGRRYIQLRVDSDFETAGRGSEADPERVKVMYSPPGSESYHLESPYSGGEIMVDFDWEPGQTYQVLSEVSPDGEGNTDYNMWISFAGREDWYLIGTMRRPKFESHLNAAYCYLLNTYPPYGYLERSATFGNIWFIDGDGIWHESLEAIFTVDATAHADYRLDFQGGVIGSQFFLRHCGFFNESSPKQAVYTRSSTLSQQPTIDFDSLPRGD